MMRRFASSDAARRGNVLVMVATLLFVMLPLASLVLQSGWLTLTRRQMQAGSDAAAVEVLRGRDASVADPEMTRRVSGREVMRALFDDDLDASADAMRFGAGPVVNFAGGTALPDTPFRAGQQIVGVGTYDPVLELNNASNDVAGDIVVGTYDETATDHVEESDYDRSGSDFVASAIADVGTADAALVRLRRSNETFADGVGSSGPTVPFLFGRGPFGGPGLPLADGETDHLTRVERGTIVRATSIASAVPAWTVGMPVSAPPTIGIASFTIVETAWTDPAIDWSLPLAVNFPGDGSIVDVATGLEVGWFVTLSGNAVAIGDRLPWQATTPASVVFGTESYGAICVSRPADRESLICGFGVVTLAAGGGTEDAFLVRSSGRVADLNASASCLGLGLSLLDSIERTDVLDAAARLQANASDTLLLAPALRRTLN